MTTDELVVVALPRSWVEWVRKCSMFELQRENRVSLLCKEALDRADQMNMEDARG